MFRNLTIGQYFPGNSVIHRLDPRTKLILIMVFIVALFMAKGLFAYVLVTAFMFAVIFAARVPIRMVFRGIRPILVILSLTLLLHFFTNHTGQMIWHWWRLSIYSGGVSAGLYLAGRLVLLVLMTSILTLTTSPISLTDGLETLLRPLRHIGVPGHELAMMMTIALRFIPTLIEEADRIMKAQMARGADFDTGNVLKRAKSLLPLLVPLFVSAFRRADELAVAMEARGYHGGEGRTRMKVLRYTLMDAAAFSVMAILTTATLLLTFRGI